MTSAGKRLLLRHGIDPTFHAEPAAKGDTVGELVLWHATDIGADLLVMGCYGHSRARELVLGGMSRTVMDSMTLRWRTSSRGHRPASL